MSFKTYTFKKTAVLTAVFCFMWSTKLVATNTPGLSEGALEVVKKKAINLLMQSQKKQALVVLSEYISRENNKNLVKAARDFRLKIAKKFLTKEAQEFYEMSLNLTVENPKASKKNNEDCLIKDPENLDCIIQKIRLLCRDRKGPLKVEDFQLAEKYFDAGEIDWVKISCEKNSSDFKTYNFFKKDADKTADSKFVFLVLEVDRSMASKNFSKAKETLKEIEALYSDWPELTFLKNKIDIESTEGRPTGSPDYIIQYKNKCKNLSKSIVRKYRYDFDLCQRDL